MTTKEQERKALAQIKEIVASLGEDSYIGTAFEGCFEDAETNIENDWALSMKDRWMAADRRLNEANGTIEELRDKLAESEKDYEAAHATAHQIAEEKDGEIQALKSRLLPDDDLADISRLLTKTLADLGKEVSAHRRGVRPAGERSFPQRGERPSGGQGGFEPLDGAADEDKQRQKPGLNFFTRERPKMGLTCFT